jgi:hypothetical protein
VIGGVSTEGPAYPTRGLHLATLHGDSVSHVPQMCSLSPSVLQTGLEKDGGRGCRCWGKSGPLVVNFHHPSAGLSALGGVAREVGGARQGVVNAVGVVGWGRVSGRGLGRGRGIDTHLTAICLTLASFLTLCCHLVAWCGRAPSRSHLWSCRAGCTSLAGTEVVTQVHRDGECWGEICRPKGPGRPFTQTGTGLTDGHIATWVGGPGLLPLLAMRETEACEAMVVLP